MPGLIYDLIDILEEETEYYSHLLVKSNEKTQLIIKNDLENIKEITTNEQIISGKIVRLEKQREEVIKDICLVLNVKDDNFTISKLAERLGNSERERDRLLEIKKNIVNKVEELRKANDKNKMLIEQSLELVSFTLNAINSRREAIGNDYKYGGHLTSSGRGNSFFDAKQ